MGVLELLFTLSDFSVDSPLLAFIGPLQSPPEFVDGGIVGEAKTSLVGRGGIVGVGCGVSVGAMVGGIGVFVGTAFCVIATIVFASATADACTSDGSMVGTAFGAQALSSAKNVIAENTIFNFILSLPRA